MPINSFEVAKAFIKSGFRIVTAMSAAEPTLFFSNLHLIMDEVKYLNVHCANPMQNYPCFSKDRLNGSLELEVMFLTKPVLNEQGKYRVHYVPQHLSQWSQNLLSNGNVDIFWGSCSYPDEQGYVSLGTNCCYESEMVRQAKITILELNKFMPYTYGETKIHQSKVNCFLENSHELPTCSYSPPSREDNLIAQFISTLIPDCSTIQLGIGGIPNAVGDILQSKKNLGIHTEVITECMVNLMKSGAVTNTHKSIYPGHTVGSFLYGSQQLYEFSHHNKLIQLIPSSFVNSISTLSQYKNMFSINTAIEVDLTGQVCSESIGHKEISGVGGAAETHIGAQKSEGGRGIIAIRSTTSDLSTSKIAFELKPGAKVSISRNDVDTIVTEYGIAHLKGLSVAKRAHAMIQIAHPKFREFLKYQAIKEGYI